MVLINLIPIIILSSVYQNYTNINGYNVDIIAINFQNTIVNGSDVTLFSVNGEIAVSYNYYVAKCIDTSTILEEGSFTCITKFNDSENIWVLDKFIYNNMTIVHNDTFNAEKFTYNGLVRSITITYDTFLITTDSGQAQLYNFNGTTWSGLLTSDSTCNGNYCIKYPGWLIHIKDQYLSIDSPKVLFQDINNLYFDNDRVVGGNQFKIFIANKTNINDVMIFNIATCVSAECQIYIDGDIIIVIDLISDYIYFISNTGYIISSYSLPAIAWIASIKATINKNTWELININLDNISDAMSINSKSSDSSVIISSSSIMDKSSNSKEPSSISSINLQSTISSSSTIISSSSTIGSSSLISEESSDITSISLHSASESSINILSVSLESSLSSISKYSSSSINSEDIHGSSHDNNQSLIIGIIVSIVAVLLTFGIIIAAIIFIIIKRNYIDMNENTNQLDEIITSFEGIISPTEIHTNSLVEIAKPISICIYFKNILDKKIIIELTDYVDNEFELRFDKLSIILKSGDVASASATYIVKCSTNIVRKICFNAHLEKDLLSNKFEQIPSYELNIQLKGALSYSLSMNDIQIGDKLGEGSFGIVYKGKWKGNEIAIKMARVAIISVLKNDIIREIELMNKLRNPYIVNCIGYVADADNIGIVTELSPFGNIDDVIKKYQLLSSTKLLMISDIVKGLHFLHSNNIIHRDIKPDNVLVFTMDEMASVRCKLTDFGTSKEFSGYTDQINDRKMTKCVGTPIYMAPEVLSGKEYGFGSDIYSLAILIWAVIHETDPYSELDVAQWELMAAIIKGTRPTIKSNLDDNELRLITLAKTMWIDGRRPSTSELIEFI